MVYEAAVVLRRGVARVGNGASLTVRADRSERPTPYCSRPSSVKRERPFAPVYLRHLLALRLTRLRRICCLQPKRIGSDTLFHLQGLQVESVVGCEVRVRRGHVVASSFPGLKLVVSADADKRDGNAVTTNTVASLGRFVYANSHGLRPPCYVFVANLFEQLCLLFVFRQQGAGTSRHQRSFECVCSRIELPTTSACR